MFWKREKRSMDSEADQMEAIAQAEADKGDGRALRIVQRLREQVKRRDEHLAPAALPADAPKPYRGRHQGRKK